MMEVEDDNVYIGRMTTDVSGNSGLDGQSEEKFYGFASMDVLLLKYYELQIRILTSGRSDIEKITQRSAKYTVMKTGMSQYVIINCQEIFVSNTRYLQNVFVKYQTNSQILDISHIHLSFKGVLQYIVYNVHYAWQLHNLVIFTVYISCIYIMYMSCICVLSYNMYIY